MAIDSATLEANAAMRSIVRRDTGEGYKEDLKLLMAEQSVENPTDDEVLLGCGLHSDRNDPPHGMKAEANSCPITVLLQSIQKGGVLV